MVIGIGSLMETLLVDTKTVNYNKKYIRIFSSGMGFAEGEFFHNPDIILPEKLKRTVKCYALRGKLTDARIAKMLGSPTGAVLGDAGLLASYLIDSDKIAKKYELGIVPHFADKDNPIFREILERIPNSQILNPTLPVDCFLRDLCECKVVISTAMHPLIACDALRIPNQWIRVCENTTSRYKFYDYYSVFDKHKEPLDLSNHTFDRNDLIEIIKNYDIGDAEVKVIQANLLNALALLSKDLNRCKGKLFLLQLIKLILLPFSYLIPIKKYRKKLRTYLKY